MKIVSRTQRVLAIIMGIAVLVTLVLQIWRDGQGKQLKSVRQYQSTTK